MRDDPYVDQYDDFVPEDDGYDYDQHFDDEDVEDYPPLAQRRPVRRHSSGQVRMPTLSRPTLPPALARADLVNDVPALAFLAVSVVGLATMAIVVGNQAGSLEPQFATHVSASGVLETFSSPNGFWRLPLLATMITLMNLTAAWFISPIDRFGSRFLLGTSLVVQFLAWVAVIRIL